MKHNEHTPAPSRWWLLLFNVAFILPTLKFGLNYEYSAIPAAFAILAIGLYLAQDNILRSVDLVLLFLIVVTVASLFVFLHPNIIKEILFFLVLYSGVIWARRYRSPNYDSLVEVILLIYLAVAFIEILVPDVSILKNYVLTRSAYDISGPRGVSSLATEPSYYGLVVFACWLICYSGRKFSHISGRVLILSMLSLILSKSTMAVLVMPLLLLTAPPQYLGRIFLGVVLVACVVAIADLPSNSRAVQVLESLYVDGLSFLLRDESAGTRLFYIIKDIDIAWQHRLLPSGPGSYSYYSAQYDLESLIPPGLLALYDFSKYGSLVGYFLVEYGVLIPILFIWLYFRVAWHAGRIQALGVVLLIGLVLFQMVSLAFAPVAFALGVFLQRLSGEPTL